MGGVVHAVENVFEGVGDVVGAVLSPIEHALGVNTPDIQAPQGMNFKGNLPGIGGKAFNENEENKKRRYVSKARLGTKQLQIPLTNIPKKSVNTDTNTGVNG
jgi:hypothetical protein